MRTRLATLAALLVAGFISAGQAKDSDDRKPERTYRAQLKIGGSLVATKTCTVDKIWALQNNFFGGNVFVNGTNLADQTPCQCALTFGHGFSGSLGTDRMEVLAVLKTLTESLRHEGNSLFCFDNTMTTLGEMVAVDLNSTSGFTGYELQLN